MKCPRELARRIAGIGAAFSLALAASALLLPVRPAGAALGDCGQPKSTGSAPTVADALEVLRTAVYLNDCAGLDPCVCDVDSSSSVTTSDALRVLRKAVGLDVELSCPCSVTTTTSTTTTTLPPEVHTTDLMVFTKMQGSYAAADLAGTWEGGSLVAGPGTHRWTRLSLVVQSNGSFTGTSTESDGGTDDIAGKLALSAAGVLTCTQNCFAGFRGAMDGGKSVMVVTDSIDDGSAELVVVAKKAGSYSQAQLQGTWSMHALESGPGAPRWGRGTFDVQSNGSFQAHVSASNGQAGITSGTLTVSAGGRVTASPGFLSQSFRGELDLDKTVITATQSQFDGSSDLLLFAKQAAVYSQADLAGTWTLGTLATGSGEPFWSRGPVTIAASGSLSGTITGSDGSMHAAAGTLSITSDGIVTMGGDKDMRCSLDSGKTVLLCTNSR